MVTRATPTISISSRQHPLLLSLLPPTIGGELRLPPPPASLPATPSPSGSEAAVREALRLRARWVQELTARAALALGRVLVDRGVLDRATAVVDLRLDELASLLESGGSLAVDLRRFAEPGPPLPASFRLTVDGTVVPVDTVRGDGGRGAGGGRGTGPVHVGTDEPPSPGDVLVVRTLDPALASLLPGLGGLVAETGSVLSHLAILAGSTASRPSSRSRARIERLVPGSWVVVDGTTGEVSPLDAGEWGADRDRPASDRTRRGCSPSWRRLAGTSSCTSTAGSGTGHWCPGSSSSPPRSGSSPRWCSTA